MEWVGVGLLLVGLITMVSGLMMVDIATTAGTAARTGYAVASVGAVLALSSIPLIDTSE